jgi:hypothetical protein
MHLAETLNEVPAIIFVCGPVAYPPNAPMEQFVWSALYPAAQNLLEHLSQFPRPLHKSRLLGQHRITSVWITSAND